MGNKKRKNKVVNSVQVEPRSSIDDERITRIIVNALIEYDKKKQEDVKAEKDKKPKGAKRNFKTILKILFRPKKYAKDMGAGTALVKIFLQALYKIVEWITLICAVLLFLIIPLQYIIQSIRPVQWYINIFYGMAGLALLLFSRVFRIAAIEVDTIQDNNYLFGLFASVTSIISLVIALVALLK